MRPPAACCRRCWLPDAAPACCHAPLSAYACACPCACVHRVAAGALLPQARCCSCSLARQPWPGLGLVCCCSTHLCSTVCPGAHACMPFLVARGEQHLERHDGHPAAVFGGKLGGGNGWRRGGAGQRDGIGPAALRPFQVGFLQTGSPPLSPFLFSFSLPVPQQPKGLHMPAARFPCVPLRDAAQLVVFVSHVKKSSADFVRMASDGMCENWTRRFP